MCQVCHEYYREISDEFDFSKCSARDYYDMLIYFPMNAKRRKSNKLRNKKRKIKVSVQLFANTLRGNSPTGGYTHTETIHSFLQIIWVVYRSSY